MMLRNLSYRVPRYQELSSLFQGLLIQPLRYDTTVVFQNPMKAEREGFPICVTSFGSFPFSPGLVREDIIRFFNKCELEEQDIMIQYSETFRPQYWWVRFHSQEDRKKARAMQEPRWGGRRVIFDEKSMRDWKIGTYNHLVGQSLGSAVLVTKLIYDTTDEDVASFFRNFHLQGNGVTLIQDPMRPNFGEQDQFKRAIVRLISKQEAQRAARSLHRRYLRSSLVSLRVLQ